MVGRQGTQESVKFILRLEGMGPRAAKAVPALLCALKDREKYVRYWAIEALGAIGPKAKDAIPALKEIADDENQSSTMRRAAGTAMKKIER
jgi:HEAT repeat protein